MNAPISPLTLTPPPPSGESSLSIERLAGGGALGRFFGARLGSEFQPIHEAGGPRVAREAFVRCGAGLSLLSPWNLFSMAADDATLIGLDRLCRTLHVLNDPLTGSAAAEQEPLFLNVHGRLLAAVSDDHGRAFRRVLDALGRPVGGVVIETPDSAAADPRLLGFVLANYRLNGFRVAANVPSLSALRALLGESRPNYVKIDIRQLTDADQVAAFIALAREQGIRPILTRVEDPALAALPHLTGAWLQGHGVAPALGTA